jgi:antitoxin component YwqK of YwqJK toxin-antitoxin module
VKKSVLLIVFLFASQFLIAQSDSLKLKLVYKQFRYNNGTIASEGFLKDNKPNGFWKSYYSTGILKSEGKWKNNKLDSLWIFYNQLGNITEKINYYLGKKNGYHFKYFNSENNSKNICSKELYVDGKRNDKSFYYYDTGSVKKVIPYLNNEKQGIGFEYDIDEKVISIIRYRKGEIIVTENINRFNKENQKTGIWKDFYSNGILKEEKKYHNDKLDGYYKIYSETGDLLEAIKYVNGEVDIKSKEFDSDIEIKEDYDKNQNLLFQGSYKKNIPIGIHRFYKNEKVVNSKTYNIFGDLISEGIVLKNGRKEGECINFYRSNKKRSTGKYFKGKKNGKWIYYYENGKVQQVGTYANGKLTGVWKWYYDSGDLLKEEFYIYGQADGESIEYTVLGNIITKGNYIEGLKEGEWSYEIGDQKMIGRFVMDQKDGIWKSYYLEEGILSFEGKYIHGNPDGKHTYFFNDGSVKEERHYKDGEKVKSWSKCDKNGKLIFVVQYRNGSEYKINGIKINLNKEQN